MPRDNCDIIAGSTDFQSQWSSWCPCDVPPINWAKLLDTFARMLHDLSWNVRELRGSRTNLPTRVLSNTIRYAWRTTNVLHAKLRSNQLRKHFGGLQQPSIPFDVAISCSHMPETVCWAVTQQECVTFLPVWHAMITQCSLLTRVCQAIDIIDEQSSFTVLAGWWLAKLVKHSSCCWSPQACSPILDRKNWKRGNQ